MNTKEHAQLEQWLTTNAANLTDQEQIELAEQCCDVAEHLIASGNSKAGYRLLEKIAELFGKHGETWAILGETYELLGRHHLALAYLRKAVAMSPADGKIMGLLGHIHYRANDLPAALAVLEKAVTLDSPLGFTFSVLAAVKDDLHHDKGVIEALSRRAVELSPDCLESWQWLAAYLESIGKHEESDQAHARYCALVQAQNADGKSEATAPPETKADAETAPPAADPVAAELKFKAIMAEAARLHPDLAAQVDALEQNLVTAFGIPVSHQAATSDTKVSCRPAWLGSKPEHLVLYSDDLPPLTLLQRRALNLVHLQMQSECARANGWVLSAQNPTPGSARQNYLQHGFGSAAKQLVRAGHDEEDVRAAQIDLIQNMTSELVNAIQCLMVSHRLSKALPGLLTENPLIPNGKSCDPGEAQATNEFYGLAPQKIARRWLILQHALALFGDGLAGTLQAELFFKNQAGRDEAVRIADYCRQAIGAMKPGDEVTITNEVMRMVRLQDFVSLLKLQVDLEKVRNAPAADATRPETLSIPEKVELWLKYLAEAEAELTRAAGRVGSKAISGIKSLSHGRHIILQGRKGQAATAGFLTNDPDIAKELPFIQKRLTNRCYEMELIEPADGNAFWALLTKFEPLKGYSMKDRMSVGAYMAEQADALNEDYARN